MNVQELIDKLAAIEDKTLPVVLYADHGQTMMKTTGISTSYVEDIDKYMLEELDEEEIDSMEYDDMRDEVLVLEAL